MTWRHEQMATAFPVTGSSDLGVYALTWGPFDLKLGTVLSIPTSHLRMTEWVLHWKIRCRVYGTLTLMPLGKEWRGEFAVLRKPFTIYRDVVDLYRSELLRDLLLRFVPLGNTERIWEGSLFTYLDLHT
ncbi:hypothetical protein AXG93_3042s1080 [Marchantia polymorpha subsp. ruderalis]|uniref:Uncharacterized protein n=1 Tax=Marchantia polymorpha subsp. ruderalis TaxID=1480154 RepID=A0A176VVG6_MARPO|nr:hypothetical protein AXG93_3042s1080 [Marchantia polymorpha subsp. ruderalis]